MKKNKNASERPGLKSRIFLSFAALTAGVIAIILLFQLVFFESIYKSVRTSETEKCAEILSSVSDGEIEESADETGEKYNACITVYKMERGSLSLLASSHRNRDCMIHTVYSDFMVYELYDRSADGDYLEVGLPSSGGNGGSTGPSVPFGQIPDERETEENDEDSRKEILFASQREKDSGRYLYVVNTELYPMSSTVSSMKLTVLFVSAVLIVFGSLISVILSNRLSRPLVKMGREARKLALGDYSASFDGGNIRESAELADTLNKASAELSQLDRMQKDLISNISHDLRTPLTLIEGYSEVMRDIPSERTEENMQVIIDETKRLSSLVNDVLDASKFASGKQELKIESFSITKTLEETVRNYSRLCEKENISITFENDGEVFVNADKTRILQVVYNLINNSMNYVGDDRKIIIRQVSSEGKCRIEVTDHGVGIEKEELPLIWERYYKAKEFHKRSSVGSGLGLSIVRDILILHKFRFGVDSTPGKGSTFWFEFDR